MIYSLIYVSRALQAFSDFDLVRLADNAFLHNRRIGVTGYLCYRNGRFLQYLEGPAAQVQALMRAIAADSRHRVENTLALDSSEERFFPDWSLRRLDGAQLAAVKVEDILDALVTQMTGSARREPQIRALAQTMARNLVGVLAEKRLMLGAPA